MILSLSRRILQKRDGRNETSWYRHPGNCTNRVSSRKRQKEAEARKFRERPRLLCHSEKQLDSQRKPIRSCVSTEDLWCSDPEECPGDCRKLIRVTSSPEKQQVITIHATACVFELNSRL